jgi:hypothetical protein
MKKAVLLIAALLVFGSFAFGQATVGAWGRGLFTVYGGGGEDSDILVQDLVSWGNPPRIGMTISGTSDNVGFQADFNVDNNTLAAGDNQKIWVKPFDMLTVQIGQFFDDTLRGNAVFGAWNWLRYDKIDGEDAIFARVWNTAAPWTGSNFEIALTPTEGAYIFAAMSQILGSAQTIESAMAVGQYGAGYTIEGIGQIRVQYVGEATYVKASSGYINAAFKLTMIDGLTVDLGVDYWMECPDQTDQQFKAALYASYVMDALTIHVYGDVLMYDADAHAGDDLAFTGALGIDYSLEGGIGVNADFRYKNDVATGMDYTDGMIAGMVGVTKGFSNGLIGVGIEITTGNFAGGPTKTDASAMVFAVPIRLEYWF